MIDLGVDAIIVASALNNKIKNSKVDHEEMVEEIKSFVYAMKKGLQRIKRN